MKTCIRCKVEKSFTEFHKAKTSKDGYQSYCKTCKLEYQRNNPNRKKTLRRYRVSEKNKTVQRQYSRSSKGKATKARSKKKYRATERGKQKHCKQEHRHRKRYPQRVRARHAISTAVALGQIPPASTLACSYCGNQAVSYHHHKDYSEKHKLDVVPLCPICHTG